MNTSKRILADLQWYPFWASHLSCLKSCLVYLGMEISDAWLFGATGQAFVLNLSDDLCPSGPTAWQQRMLWQLGKNLGFSVSSVHSVKGASDFEQCKERAWEQVLLSTDKGLPSYGWEFELPEYYLIKGYDESGYLYLGPQVSLDEELPRKPWEELGAGETGIIEVNTVSLSSASSDRSTIRAAFQFAVALGTNPRKWISPPYKAGRAGYENWITALRDGKANELGLCYNAAFWAECRSYAWPFLLESQSRLSDPTLTELLGEASDFYKQVAYNLSKVATLYPMPPPPGINEDKARRVMAIDSLNKAMHAEEAGIDVLRTLIPLL